MFSFSTGAWDEKWKVVYAYNIGKTLLKVMQEWKSNFECRALTSSRSSTILLRMSVSSLLWHISAVTTPGGKRQGSQCAVCVWVCVCFGCLRAFACLCTHNTGWRSWWDRGAKSLCPSCKTQSNRRSPPAHTSQTSNNVCFDLITTLTYTGVACTVSGLFYLHGAAAHGDHLEQGDCLHVFLSAVAASWSLAAAGCCLGLFALDVLCAFVDPLPSSLGGCATWKKD